MYLKRAGIIGDVHCEDGLLRKVFSFFSAHTLDTVMCTGDIADGPGDIASSCQQLIHTKTAVVAGNHERWFLHNANRNLPYATHPDAADSQTVEYLHSLPVKLQFDTAAGPLMLCHGIGENDMACVYPEDSGAEIDTNKDLQSVIASGKHNLVLNGHTHKRMVRTIGPLTIINAGTLYRPHSPCFSIIDFVKLKIQYYEIDADGRISNAESKNLPCTK